MPTSGITKRMLGEALKECMRQQPLAKVSIQDIVTKCGLTRNSFYYHFKDKYDLMNWVFYTEFAAGMEDYEDSGIWGEFQSVFEFFYRDREFYANALTDEGQNSFSDYFQEVITRVLMEETSELFPICGDREFFAVFFVDALLLCIKRWLTAGATRPPAEMTRLMRMIMTGMISMLEEPAPE